MKIFKDILTNAEVVCDNDKPFDIEGDIVYVVKGRYIEIGGEDYGISANADDEAAEGATGDVDSAKQRVIDVVYNNRYTETSYDKSSYMAHIRGYMKRILENIENEDEKKAFQANAAAYVKSVLKEIDEYQFFIPEGNEEDPDNGLIVLCKWEGEVPSFYLWKDGLKGERV